MLTRLKVSGFKNLVDVDVRFGAFTCIAGANGVGKSNLFDAIQFLSALSTFSLNEAALSIRNDEEKNTDIRGLFHCVGEEYAEKMSFTVEMIVPGEGIDDLGQEAKASSTFLHYELEIGYRMESSGLATMGKLVILKEELTHITRKDLSLSLPFENKKDWIDSIFQAQARKAPFISTESRDEITFIRLHQDSGVGGKKRGGFGGKLRRFLAEKMPRTVLSDANSAEGRTALLARREMQSWKILQLEPSALRQPDSYSSPTRLTENGLHLPAVLYRLASQNGIEAETIYSQIANTLADLIEDVDSVSIDNDPKRQLLTLQVKSRNGTIYPARSLSDGTLRFLALAVLKLDPEAKGLICLEEPENGIHPAGIPKILQLLKDIATDTEEKVGADNPLRQVIINTHSPVVVQEVPEDSLLIAELRESIQNEQRFKRVCFSYLDNTWRAKAKEHKDTSIIVEGDLLAYLNPVPIRVEANTNEIEPREGIEKSRTQRTRRVREREDLQPLIPGLFGEAP